MTSTSEADVLPQRHDAEQTVARPLRVLAPLIQDDLKQGREAAERAALPFYCAAGEKLLEAKAQLKHGEFQSWVKRTFQVSVRMTRHYMNLAEEAARQKGNALPFSSLRDFIRETSTPGPGKGERRLHKHLKHLERLGDLQADPQLALEIIDVGYKTLARERHPDKGGLSEDMVRLNRMANTLRTLVRNPYSLLQ